MLPFWDMLFRTPVDPAKTEVEAMGIEGDPIRTVSCASWLAVRPAMTGAAASPGRVTKLRPQSD